MVADARDEVEDPAITASSSGHGTPRIKAVTPYTVPHMTGIARLSST
jgi:hypothetical protein